MKLSRTYKTEQAILLRLRRSERPLNLSRDIKPMFRKGAPVTFALWNLRKRGDIKRIGRGTGMYQIAVRIGK
jgi:hypothetical protein